MTTKLRFFLGCGAMLTYTGAAWAGSALPQVQHVIIIMQENRSFDSYFGTYPGANGIPTPAPCLPLSMTNPTGPCVAPFHDVHNYNAGSEHFSAEAATDIDNGVTTALMDGFAANQVKYAPNAGTPCDNKNPLPLWCWSLPPGIARHDVMGYHTSAEIPNYWAYAQHFRLLDGMFPTVRSWSATVHIQMTSEWAATCKNYTQALTCTSSTVIASPTGKTEYPWASLFQLLDANNVTWRYYLGTGKEPDCDAEEGDCNPAELEPGVYGFWNPAPYYAYVKAQPASYLKQHVVNIDNFLLDIKNGNLSQVSWIVPSQDYSEHPPADVTLGMDYTTALVNAVMQSPTYWPNTVIFLTWDDWGGFYDHVQPPLLLSAPKTAYGFGIRVPAITIGAYVTPGVDHNTYSFDSYARFIEDQFAGGARLIPANLNNPDNRPFIADSLTQVTSISGATVPLGDLTSEFDFTQTMLPPLVLSTNIPGGLRTTCNTVYAPTCSSTTVSISWDALGGASVLKPTYHVQRDGVDIPACVTTATKCTDTPGSGDHIYAIYSVIGSNASPVSAVNEIVEP